MDVEFSMDVEFQWVCGVYQSTLSVLESVYHALQRTWDHEPSPSAPWSVWYWKDTSDKYISFDHLAIVAGGSWLDIINQKRFYEEMYDRLSRLRV
jgi:hypothetical protein